MSVGIFYKESIAQKGDIVIGEEELVAEILVHSAELAVDKLQRATEVLRTNSHESLHHIYLRFAATEADNIVAQSRHQVLIRCPTLCGPCLGNNATAHLRLQALR